MTIIYAKYLTTIFESIKKKKFQWQTTINKQRFQWFCQHF